MSTSDNSSRRGPGGIADLFDRFLQEEAVVRGQIDKNARALAQSALARLDVVSRDEFDAQRAQLERTQQRVADLEQLLEQLSERLQAAEQGQTPASDQG
jgi:hypothetical protein